MLRVITYIDGFNLYFGLKAGGSRRFYWLDIHRLSQRLLKPNQTLQAVKYFTSRISASAHDPGKERRQSAYLEAITTLPRTSCYFGHFLEKDVQCLFCKKKWKRHEEKMTDVNIAVEMLTDAQQNLFDVALLLSADSDLSGPVEHIRRLYPAKRVIAIFPPNRTSGKLRSIANASFQLGEALIRQSLLPDPVIKPDGFAIARPATWV